MNRFTICIIGLILFAVCLATSSWGSDARVGVFERISPEEAGFSVEKLDTLVGFCEEAGSAALLILQNGKVVLSWGEVEKEYPIHSIRKSFLNALYGICVSQGFVDTSATLEELGIDDIPPSLTDSEKQATVFDLLRSRSGVYHPAAAEAQVMIDTRPERGSHAPGTFFYYNNWDFNALGTIFEQETGLKIYEVFYEEVAKPIGMKDFTPDDGFYMLEEEKSKHSAYHFRMTAHDMALFGMLYMQGGVWNEKQIVPEDWIELSTRMHSVLNPQVGIGYGMLWYVLPESFGLGRAFMHTGAGVHMLAVFPDLGMVAIHRVDTESSEVRFTYDKMIRVFDLIVEARTN